MKYRHFHVCPIERSGFCGERILRWKRSKAWPAAPVFNMKRNRTESKAVKPSIIMSDMSDRTDWLTDLACACTSKSDDGGMGE